MRAGEETGERWSGTASAEVDPARSEAPECCSAPRTPGGGTTPTSPRMYLEEDDNEEE